MSFRGLMLFVTIIIVGGGVCSLRWSRPLSVDGSVKIVQGDTVRSFFSLLDTREEYRLRWYLHQSPESLQKLQEGTYMFSGSLSPASFVEVINQGPKQVLEKITILEGRSMYDTDAMLAAKGLIATGDYIKEVQPLGMGIISDPLLPPSHNPKDFLFDIFDDNHDNAIDENDRIIRSLGRFSLEGFLYPDTYLINPNTDVLHQLTQLQLKAFYDKVWKPYSSQILSFGDRLKEDGYSFDLSPYHIITLASIIEKEEKSSTNKPTIAGLFLNRIEKGMRIDADITLCYGRALPYETCTPSVISQSINDAHNSYNTRVQSGLTPTPIGNPSVETIRAVLEFVKTANLYYLHDAQGQIYFAENIQGHNSNKSTHL